MSRVRRVSPLPTVRDRTGSSPASFPGHGWSQKAPCITRAPFVHDHRCTLFDFLVEVRGSDRGLPWSSVGLSTGYRANPRVSTARATAFHCTWRFHGKCYGCGHDTCRGSVRGNLRGTNHGNPQKYHVNCHGVFHGHLHTVGVAVGLSVVPWPAVVCRGLPWRLPWRLPWTLPWRLPCKLLPWASTVFRYLPRHSVEAHGMSVEARGVSAVARGVSTVARGMPWK